MQNTLDLDPEWGAIDLIDEVEQVFNFTIRKEEAERCATVGDLYTVICGHVPDWDAQSGKCASSMTFYRIRRALDPERSRIIAPKSPLQGSDRPYALFSKLSRETGLRLPLARSTPIGTIGGLIFTGGMLAAIVALLTTGWEIAGLAFGAGLIGLLTLLADRGRLPAGVESVGDLVRRTAPLNARELRSCGGRPSDRWSILASLAAEHGSLSPDQIAPETFLHRASLKLTTSA